MINLFYFHLKNFAGPVFFSIYFPEYFLSGEKEKYFPALFHTRCFVTVVLVVCVCMV